MSRNGMGASFLEQVKNVILTDKETQELRERFESALFEEISTWVIADWRRIREMILDRAAKREFCTVLEGTRIAGEVSVCEEWRTVENAALHKLYSEALQRGLLPRYFDVEFSEQYGFSMRFSFPYVVLGESGNSTYRVCSAVGNSYVVQLMDVARRNGVVLLCHDAPVCLAVQPAVARGASQTLRFSYSVTV